MRFQVEDGGCRRLYVAHSCMALPVLSCLSLKAHQGLSLRYRFSLCPTPEPPPSGTQTCAHMCPTPQMELYARLPLDNRFCLTVSRVSKTHVCSSFIEHFPRSVSLVELIYRIWGTCGRHITIIPQCVTNGIHEPPPVCRLKKICFVRLYAV